MVFSIASGTGNRRSEWPKIMCGWIDTLVYIYIAI